MVESDVREIIRIPLTDSANAGLLFGTHDANLKRIEEAFGARIVMRRDELVVTGKLAIQAAGAIEDILWILESGEAIDGQKLEYVIHLNEGGSSYRTSGSNNDVIAFTHRGKPIKAKTLGQSAYVEAIRTHDIVFSIGPAGTGKTYLAIAEALRLVLSKKMRKLVLTRPVVEAGESLGYLPGDLAQKINPYLRPLYDAMEALVPYETIRHLEETRAIEVAPLAYMRGRSLNDCAVILDEAQNTTKEQMKMFLTRIGQGARAIITGDATQIDLPRRTDSGLLHALSILSSVEGIYIAYLNTADVVRNPLIKKIIEAYDAENK